MSKTYMSISVGFTAHSPEHLPEKDGEPMYAAYAGHPDYRDEWRP